MEELTLSNCGAREDSWESLGHKIKPVSPKGNQPRIFIGRTDVEAEAPILWPPDAKSQLTGKDPSSMVGKTEGRRRRRWQRMRWLDGIPDSMDMNLSKLREMVKNREAWRAVVHGVTKSRAWLSDWTTTLQKPWEKQTLFFLMRAFFALLCFLACLGPGSVLSLSLAVVSGAALPRHTGFSLQGTGSRCTGLSSCSLQALEPMGSAAVGHGLSCSLACGIFPNQGSNPCPLRWQADY